MEKAFDRVSYEFTLKGLKALGFGKYFRSWVKMMYDVKNPPERRMYVDGYYSSWFEVKSGVAQGCPLSPLLFLVVAQALTITIKKEKQLKGIEVNGTRYNIAQFADDTTLFLRSKREIKIATEVIKGWCRATGMRERLKEKSTHMT
jgi:hypothetical protein